MEFIIFGFCCDRILYGVVCVSVYFLSAMHVRAGDITVCVEFVGFLLIEETQTTI